jgi:hypothetical protein
MGVRSERHRSTIMANLYDILAEAKGGETMAMLGREFGLTEQQTEAAVMALLPAISHGLKNATSTAEGLGNLFGVMGQQQDLHAMYGDPRVAFASSGRTAGNDVLSVIFGSPEVSRAVVDQAQQFSGIGSDILKKMLPVLAGILISGLMKGGSGQSVPKGSPAAPGPGGALGDILGQIFGRGLPGSASAPTSQPQMPAPGGQPIPTPSDPGGQTIPSGDLLGYVLRELEKGLREGRIKPVIIEGGPIQLPMPGGQGGPNQIPIPGGQRGPTSIPMPDPQAGPTPSGPQAPGDILGQILRDLLGGAGGPARMPQQRPGPSPQMKDLSDMSKQLGVKGGVGAALFGDQFEVGRDVERDHLENIQNVFDRFLGTQRR